MLSVNKLSIYFSGRFLFDDVSYLINADDHIGLVGKNGAGKSTMLKILAGTQVAESGEISKPTDFNLGYLPQEMNHRDGLTVMQETLTAFDELQKTSKEMDEVAHKISTTTDTSSNEFLDLLTRHHDLEEKFRIGGGYEMEGETEKILLGLGFERKDFDRFTQEFSGGWRMRIELAKILLKRPDLVLLDEPTNHLDIESVQWLENFLKTYNSAIVMVSHDKIFLDAVTNRTIEIINGRVEDYKCAYSKYVELRAERRAMQESAKINQDKQIADMERFVERFKAKASKATQAQSKQKQIDKIERIEIDNDEVTAMRFRFPEPPRSGQVAVHAVDVEKNFADLQVLKGLEFDINRQDKIAFVGRNGEGKSTLSKILANVDKASGGLIEFGHNVQIGYYAQNQAEELDGNKTVLQTIDDEAVGDMRLKVRSLLGAFLFSGDSVEKKVKILSGGEKARLALAKLLLRPVNLLVMDEPTNHLDMMSKAVLKEALSKYGGALILVSHDRDFMQGLTNRVFAFRHGKIKEYAGDIYDYLRENKIETLDEPKEKKAVKKESAEVKKELSRDQQKSLDNQRKKLDKKIKQVEDEIQVIEAEKAAMEKKINSTTSALDQIDLSRQYQQIDQKLNIKMNEWENVNEELESLKS
ncbi:MAG: ATP-binding cassette domain-containing protein [Bacteroidota bacterium]|nr:ATP-binding cassette domain-containing protein [Bacteroidota bacterium]